MELIGIAGGTCSGKSTLARRLKARLADRCDVIPLDNYYRASDLSEAERAALDHDLPSAFDWNLLFDHLTRLRESVPVEMPLYDFELHNRIMDTARVDPRDAIILEGLYAFYDSRIKPLVSIKVYLESTVEERRRRRLRRDLAERHAVRSYIEQKFDSLVEPAYRRYVEPAKYEADLVTYNLAEAFDFVLKYFNSRVRLDDGSTNAD